MLFCYISFGLNNGTVHLCTVTRFFGHTSTKLLCFLPPLRAICVSMYTHANTHQRSPQKHKMLAALRTGSFPTLVTGRIKMLREPHSVRGPQVADPWRKETIEQAPTVRPTFQQELKSQGPQCGLYRPSL